MADGAACFGQGSSDPALLRVPAGFDRITGTGLSPPAARLSRRVPLHLLLPCRLPYNPARASTPAVWAIPLSPAATRGVTVVFLSSDYLDVSVRRVRPRFCGCRALARRVSPFGHPRITGCSRLPAEYRRLPRPSSPPGATGIPRAPSLACPRPPGFTAERRRSLRQCLTKPQFLTGVFAVSTISRFPSILSMNRRGFAEASASRRIRGECGARTHDPRLAKPVL